uniref:Type I polyketide synthase n=1 Tax=Gambierdiscus excentricus TaxID=986170 RepID=A0A1S6K841_9DINO|nr:type I polyketide synthase [Gambierdiscus excentricus]
MPLVGLAAALGMVAFLASEEELNSINDLISLRKFAELQEEAWAGFSDPLGFDRVRGLAGLRVFAQFSARQVSQQCKVAKVGDRSLTPIQLTQVGFMWRVARQKAGLSDEDPFAPGNAEQQTQPQRKDTLAIVQADSGQEERIRQLEKKLEQALAEKDKLAKQLESVQKAETARKPFKPLAGFVDKLELEWRRHGPKDDAVVRGLAYVHGCEDFFMSLLKGEDFAHSLHAEPPPGPREDPMRFHSFRWDHVLLYDPKAQADKGDQKVYTKHACLLEGMEDFDHKLFRLQKDQAEQWGPQVRKCVEAGYEALLNGNVTARISGDSDTAVYVGCMTNDWFTIQNNNQFEARGRKLQWNEAAIMSRVLDLHGPSETVDTACSSSLVACHYAADQILLGRCGLALAAGVCYMGVGETFINRCALNLLSLTGRSMCFSPSADGYCRGEAYGALLLERLGQGTGAVDKGVFVAGSCVNQDGRSAGLVAPNGSAQDSLLKNCHKVAGMMPDEVSCVECASNGSALGDSIEFAAIARVHGGHATALSAVKSNKGHTEGGSGVTGLVKTIVSMQFQQVLPFIHLAVLNPNVALFDYELPVRWGRARETLFFATEVLPQATHWEHTRPVSMGVSAFGFGGTNAHAILARMR